MTRCIPELKATIRVITFGCSRDKGDIANDRDYGEVSQDHGNRRFIPLFVDLQDLDKEKDAGFGLEKRIEGDIYEETLKQRYSVLPASLI